MKAKRGFRLRPLGNEYILYGEGLEQINFNKMITLNETAAFLWQQVEGGKDFDAQILADALLSEYEVSAEQALIDAQATIDAWLKAEIIA